MMQKVAIFVLVTVAMLVAMVAAETKKDTQKKDKYAKGNPHRDHLLFLGNKEKEEEFDELEEEEAIERLTLLATKIDRDGDGKVSKDELTYWLIQSFLLIDKEDAYKDFKHDDDNKDEKVTWQEYLAHHNTTEKDLKALRNKKDRTKEEENVLKELQEDEIKFKLADTNRDGSLNIEEYFAFSHPETVSYTHMHKFVLDEAMMDYDKNKDGKLSFKEYVEFEEESDEDDKDKEINPEDEKEDKEKFELHDINKDGFLDKTEFLPLVVEDYREEADEEAEHLIKEADDDNDKHLSIDEFKEHVDTFVGHAVTGGHDASFLHYVKQEDEL